MTTTSAETESPVAPLQMYADVSPDGEAESVIPVRWCVGLELIATLKERRITDAKVLFVITRNQIEIERKLVPLLDEMTYLRFTAPGENVVQACVVYGSGTKHLLSRYRHDAYTNLVLDPWGKLDERMLDLNGFDTIEGVDTLTVQVPGEMFAKEPPAWVKKFATIFFDEPVEQCDTRRQFLITLPLLPIVTIGVVLGAIGSVLISTLLLILFALLGFRGLKLSPLWHPYSEGPIFNCRRVKGEDYSSVWLHKDEGLIGGNHYAPSMHFRHPVFFALNPVTIAGLIGVAFAINAIAHLHWSWLHTLLVGVGVITVAVAICVAVGTSLVRWWNANETKRDAKLKAKSQKEREEYMATLDAMACNGTRTPKVGALAKDKRTVKLRFLALKSKVCRPYAAKR